MAIDPMLYEKVSGRSGDPSKRLGEALAKSDRRGADRRAAKEAPNTTGTGLWGFWLFGREGRGWFPIVVAVVLVLGLARVLMR